MHWSEISPDPNAPQVRSFLTRELLDRRAGRISNISDFVTNFVRDRSVLDIGVAQHDIAKVDSPTWKHEKIRKVAARTVGVDILEDQVHELVRRGYDVRVADATSAEDLGERFDRVVVGDVIEHVGNPVALLQFAKRHLKPGGLALFTTPNPLFIVYTLQALRSGPLIPNAEHVSWISPTMALELGHRADFPLSSYWHVQGEGKTLPRKFAVRLLSWLGIRDKEPFSGSFYYIFTAGSAERQDDCAVAMGNPLEQ